MSVCRHALAGVLAACALSLVAACGSPLAVKSDPHAVVHSYTPEGFSIAYGPQWQASQKSATSQTAWQLQLTQRYSSSAGSGVVLISIGVQPEHAYSDPAVYQAKYEQMLKALGGSPQSITLSGVPAVYWKGMTGYGVSLTSGGRSYILMGLIPNGGDAKERPQVLAVLDSFKLLAAGAAASQVGASQTEAPPTASSPPSSQPTPASSQPQSAQYVDQVGPVIVAFNQQLGIVGEAQGPWSAQDVSTWPAYRKATEVAVAQFSADERNLQAIDPPASFKEAHVQLVRCVGQIRAAYAYLGARLKSGQPESQWMSQVVTRFTTAHETLVLFRSDFTTAASQTGVNVGFDLP